MWVYTHEGALWVPVTGYQYIYSPSCCKIRRPEYAILSVKISFSVSKFFNSNSFFHPPHSSLPSITDYKP